MILKLEKAVIEIKCYSAPPQAVKDIMPIIYLLLGHKEKEVSVSIILWQSEAH